MRYIPVAFCFGAMAFAVSCREQPQELVGGPGVVNIILNCEQQDRGVNFRIVPWRQGIAKRTDSFTWKLVASNVASVEIWPADPLRWPFAAPPPIMVPPGVGSGLKDITEAPAGIYKYEIRGICVRSTEEQDTVVVDPDMIIPD